MSKAVEIKASDLNQAGEVFCPSPLAGMELRNSHPRVYINVSKHGEGKCPYCGTVYKLKEGEVVAHGH